MAWQNILAATFRKIPFDVEAVSDAVQRSAVLNEYPYRDGAEVEDLGLGPNRIRITALLWSRPGDDYEPRLQVLLAALRTADAGELVHPIFGTIPRAVCTGWTVEHDAENRDRCTVQMEFVESRAAERIFTTPSPVVAAEVRINDATDERVRADLAGLPALLDQVDRHIADGTIGGARPNAADFQIATSVRLMLCAEDVQPLVEGRPAAALARRLVPVFPGRVPAGALPAEWLPTAAN